MPKKKRVKVNPEYKVSDSGLIQFFCPKCELWDRKFWKGENTCEECYHDFVIKDKLWDEVENKVNKIKAEKLSEVEQELWKFKFELEELKKVPSSLWDRLRKDLNGEYAKAKQKAHDVLDGPTYWAKLKIRRRCFVHSYRVVNSKNSCRIIFTMKPNALGKLLRYKEFRRGYITIGPVSSHEWKEICGLSSECVSDSFRLYLKKIWEDHYTSLEKYE